MTNHEEWLRKAQDDELSINAILTEQGAPSTACFLSQQMAEKYLKGLLIFWRISFPKVHDLLELETLLSQVGSSAQEIHQDLALLNRYYIETRYPGDYPAFNWNDAQDAFQAAVHVKDFVIGKIKSRS